jgi:hypothetical protein
LLINPLTTRKRWPHIAGRSDRQRLQRTRRRGPDGDDPALLAQRPADRFGSDRGHFVLFGLHAMVVDVIDAHRLKRAIPDVQCDRRTFHTGACERGEQLRCEVQARRRSGDRPAPLRINRLITVAVLGAIGTLDVRRQRHMPDTVHGVLQRCGIGPETYAAPAVKAPIDDLSVDDRGRVPEDKA